MKITLINHTFQQMNFCKRWEILANTHKDWDITLLAPSEYLWGDSKTLTFGVKETKKAVEYNHENFHIKPIKIKRIGRIGWISSEMIRHIVDDQPDVVYHIGSHTQPSLMQILDYKRKHNKSLRVFAFSMRGPQSDLTNLIKLRCEDKSLMKKIARTGWYYIQSSMVKKLNKYCDAIFCHYPTGMECFRREGYRGPIFMQTQVGVDVDVFHKDLTARESIRKKYRLGDSFIFVSAVRFDPSKGIMKVLDALPLKGNWKYLLIGWGTDDNVLAVKNRIKERGIEDKVVLPGYLPWEEMAAHWNAGDCAIHFPQSETRWVETFSLSLVQAMATELPVIGSASGSVPYQIGPDGWILDENDVAGLHNRMQFALEHPDEAKAVGKKMYERAISSFSTRRLNELFYVAVNELINGEYNQDHIDMANNSIDKE